MSGQDDAEESRRRYQASYTSHHPIPTIQRYREEKEQRRNEAGVDEDEDDSPSKRQHAKEPNQRYKRSEDDDDDRQQRQNDDANQASVEADHDDEEDVDEGTRDTTEGGDAGLSPKDKRKGSKKRNDERAERQVTDPVTHLPVTIHDFTSAALKDIDENAPPSGSTLRTATGLSNKSKSDKELKDEEDEMQRGRQAMDNLFPPPEFDAVRKELASITKLGTTIGLAFTAGLVVVVLTLERLFRLSPIGEESEKQRAARNGFSMIVTLALFCFSFGAVWAVILGIRDWMERRIQEVWDKEIWEADRVENNKLARSHETESTQWLNSLLASVWPLVNPDLFTSLADTLEDVMQASLPRLVRMVSVEDIGQGSESLRILGVRWLPTGAAAKSVGADGHLQKKDKQQKSDRTVPGDGEVQRNNSDKNGGDSSDKSPQEEEEGEEVAEGMEAEEGDFVNLEVAFAYKARTSGKNAKNWTKDAHLFLAFYLPGNLKLPVWVDLQGFIGTMRMRLQLTPDPPFFALCTLTFLGQPKVNLSCIPLVRKGLNIMDVPLISNFVQSAVNAAMAEYVAPKSLTLDLKDMISGDDFKKDTTARGVLVVRILRGFDFRASDPGIPLIKDSSADPYVSVGWAKFGKAVFSTRVLLSNMEPWWDETAYILVTPDELNVEERIRLQLWDSDRTTADDDLGRIELNLKDLMKDKATNGKMCDRVDGFKALKAGEDMPGKLEWSVGYFSKTRIQPLQLEQQTYDKTVKTLEQLNNKVDEISSKKLREHKAKGMSDELNQQREQEKKSILDQMIISAPPPDDYPSGIFSIQIHQIVGLEFEQQNKNKADKDAEASDEEETGEGLPSSYCTVIVNHRKVFKTRTKPKNAKPFFNAGTERFVGDWHNAEVHISVRDARVHEDNALLGIVHLPLAEVFKDRSQVNGFYPLTGGIGFGRIRISMCWRSVQLQAPREALGWDYGTLEIKPETEASSLPRDLQSMNLKFKTLLSSGKMYPAKGEHKWQTRKGSPLHVPVKTRYASNLAVQFRSHTGLGVKTAAFAILWLKDIPDDEEKTIVLPVWTGDFKRATANSLPSCGEKVGEIKVTLTYWAGLSGYHGKFVSKDRNLRDVAEVLDTARDNYENKQSKDGGGEAGDIQDHASDSSSGEDYGSSDDTEKQSGEGRKDGNDEHGDHGPVASLKDYKKHAKDLSRRHRGLMQWKIPRTAQWAKHKLDHGESKISALFKHHSREPDIDTEV